MWRNRGVSATCTRATCWVLLATPSSFQSSRRRQVHHVPACPRASLHPAPASHPVPPRHQVPSRHQVLSRHRVPSLHLVLNRVLLRHRLPLRQRLPSPLPIRPPPRPTPIPCPTPSPSRTTHPLPAAKNAVRFCKCSGEKSCRFERSSAIQKHTFQKLFMVRLFNPS